MDQQRWAWDSVSSLAPVPLLLAEQKHKEINNSNAQNPSAESEEHDEDILPLTLEEKENKEYLKSLLEILILMGKQNIPLDGHEADEIPEGLFTPDNFQALLECRINSGEEVLRKRFETTAVNTLFCSKTQQKQMLEICESCIKAFGKNLQGQTSDVFFAASSLTAVLHSLNEVMENIEVYHEFWFEEATSLATKLDIQVKLPGKFQSSAR
ncbi:52 Kda Repressor Of The Inhibitor Of The Protein Kinase [Manis pentadactyla]|nr:52 Kda Repressor Of The Inhibitor Of The Protein Kinase [Manis pentadactyla]